MKKGEQWSVLTVIIKCEISCTHPIVTIKDGRHRLIGSAGGAADGFYIYFLDDDDAGEGFPSDAYKGYIEKYMGF